MKTPNTDISWPNGIGLASTVSTLVWDWGLHSCILGLCVLFASCSQNPSLNLTATPIAVTGPISLTDSNLSSVPLHWKMAIVHATRGGEGLVPVDGETMLSERFGLLLEKVAHKCQTTELKIANMTVESHNLILEAGISFELSDLMEKYNLNVSAACGNMGYGDAPSGSYRQQQQEYLESQGGVLDPCALVYASTTLFLTEEDLRVTSDEYQNARDDLARVFENLLGSVDEAMIGL